MSLDTSLLSKHGYRFNLPSRFVYAVSRFFHNQILLLKEISEFYTSRVYSNVQT